MRKYMKVLEKYKKRLEKKKKKHSFEKLRKLQILGASISSDNEVNNNQKEVGK